MKKNPLAAVAAGLLAFSCAIAGAQAKPGAFEGYDIGVIFNTDDLLMDFESYQGGVGLKLSGEKLAYRILFDVFYSTASDSLASSLGFAIERHLATGRVTPYIGGYLTIGYASTKSEVSSDTWTKTTSIPATAGGLFGVEVYLLRFLSFFAEYDLSATMSYASTENSVAGVESSDSTTDWTVQLGSGNQSKIGINIYFKQGRNFALEPIGKGRG